MRLQRVKRIYVALLISAAYVQVPMRVYEVSPYDRMEIFTLFWSLL